MTAIDLYKCNDCRNEVVFDADAPSAGDCGDPGCDRKGRWIHVGRDCGRLLWVTGPYPRTKEYGS